MRSIAAALTGSGWVVACLWCAAARADRLDDIIAQINKAGPPPATTAPAYDPPLPVHPTVAQADPSTLQIEREDDEAPPVPARIVGTTAASGCAPAAVFPSREHDPAFTGSVGLRYGNLVIDGESAGWFPELVLQGGVHLDRFTVLGEYAGSIVHHDADTEGALPATSSASTLPVNEQTTDGVMHRLGVYGRYALARGMSQPDSAGGAQSIAELYLQLGGGMEIIQWDLGGRLVRPEVSAAIGFLAAHRSGPHARHGWFLDARFQVARRIDRDDAAPTCAAPCTEETPPVAWSDRSVLFETGFLFGR
jgi:hypothetical protein